MALLTNINGKFSVSDAGAVTFNNAFTFPTADGNANYVLQTNGSGQISWAVNGNGDITGSGTANTVTKFTGAKAIGDGPITFATNNSTFAGNVAINTFASITNDAGIAGISIRAKSDNICYIDFGDSADSNIGGINYSNINDTLNFRTGNTNKVTIDSSGNSTFAGEITSGDDINTPTKIVVGESAAPEVRLKKTNTGNAKLSFYNNDGTSSTQQSYLSLDATENIVLYGASGVGQYFYAGGVLNETKIGANSTFAGNVFLPDAKKVVLGSGSDFQLYHDGSNSYIQNLTGWLNIPLSQNGVSIANADFSESLARFLLNGACELYYDGTKRFETVSGGAKVTGDLEITGSLTGAGAFVPVGGGTFIGTAASGAALVTIENNSGSTATSYGLLVKGGGNSASGKTFEVRDDSGNTDLIVKGNGNVGIGTDSPGARLDVLNTGNYETIRIGNSQADDTNKQGGITALNYIGNSTSIFQYATNAGANVVYYGSADGSFRGLTQHSFMVSSGPDTVSHAQPLKLTAAKVTMAADVTMSGSVGIGETTLQRKFNLYDGTDTWTRVQCGASTADWIHGIAGSDHTYKWYNQSSNGGVGYKMALATSGVLTVSSDVVAYGSPSDKRLKENIKPIESALDKVSKLQGVTFDWKESDSILNIKEDIGFIAQDVQKVIPELVRENEDGMLSMRHQGIAPILLEAIKELKAEIEELKFNKCNCNK